MLSQLKKKKKREREKKDPEAWGVSMQSGREKWQLAAEKMELLWCQKLSTTDKYEQSENRSLYHICQTDP